MSLARGIEGYRRLTDGRSSATMLVVANLWDLAGVFLLGWNVFILTALFWAENLVLGLLNVGRILFAGGSSGGPRGILARMFLSAFFLVHYGIFCMVHGLAVVSLLGDMRSLEGRSGPIGMLVAGMTPAVSWSVIVAVALLFASHLYSFGVNYLRGGEYRRTSPDREMIGVYGRIVVLHAAVMVGALLIALTGLPRAFAAALIPFKIILDLRGHARERRRYAAGSDPIRSAGSPGTV
ncbi:MAG TPA: DUF6498-containing protein [Planctomycetota bacterium]|nr:DUF6498-containing protein [Planctomycetota bacterium]